MLAVGSMVKTAEEVRLKKKEAGYACSLVNARFVKPIDEEMVKKAAAGHKLIVTLEENVASGGFGEKVRNCLDSHKLANNLLSVHIPDAYVEHGSVDLLKKEIGMDAESIFEQIKKCMA